MRNLLLEVPGRKALVLDQKTKSMISSIYTMSELWEFDVYLIEDLGRMSTDKDANELKTVVISSPAGNNIDAICSALQNFEFTNEVFLCKLYSNLTFFEYQNSAF